MSLLIVFLVHLAMLRYIFISLPCFSSSSLSVLQELDISCIPGQRRKWLFVWLVKLGDDDNLPPVSLKNSFSLVFVWPSLHLPVALFTVSLISVPGSSSSAVGTEGLSVLEFTQSKYPGSGITWPPSGHLLSRNHRAGSEQPQTGSSFKAQRKNIAQCCSAL